MAGTLRFTVRLIPSQWLMTKYFVVSGFRKLIDRLEAAPELVREEAENMADEIGNIGAQTMRCRVVSSGTDFSRRAQ